MFFFLNHIQSIKLAIGGLQSSCEDDPIKDDQRKMDAPELNLECQRKGVEYLLTQDISAFHFQLISKKNSQK